MKVKDEVVLAEWVHAIVIPEELRNSLADSVSANLADKVIYIKNDCKDIWDWSEKYIVPLSSLYESLGFKAYNYAM